MLIVALPPTEVEESTDFPDPDTSQVYDHLRHYCSKFFPIPAIRSYVQGDKITVIAGHKYLRIARELNHPTIRSIIEPKSPEQAVKVFLERGEVTALNVKDIEQEGDIAIAHDWQVFFFAQPLDQASKEAFEALIGKCFAPTTSSLLRQLPQSQNPEIAYHFGDRCAELQIWTPVADQKWILSFIETCRHFSETCARIDTYQGRKFYPVERT